MSEDADAGTSEPPDESSRCGEAVVAAGGGDESDGDGEGDDQFVEMDPKKRYGRYAEILGRGASKVVFRAFDKAEGIEVAWNQVWLRYLADDGEGFAQIQSEIRLLNSLNHRNIVRLHHSWIDLEGGRVNFITELLCSGSLKEYRWRHRQVKLRAVKNWARQILEGLVYLHSHNPPIIHRDLKCDNIFVNGNSGELKIGDLGLATILRKSGVSTSAIGTPEFMAPEMYQETYNELVDVYSFGMCLLELITLEFPYSECANVAQIYRKVTSGVKPAALSKVKDGQARRFIETCLTPAHDRPPASLLLSHPFLLTEGSLLRPVEAYEGLLKPTEAYHDLSRPTEGLLKPTMAYQSVSSPTEAYQGLSNPIEAYQGIMSPILAYQSRSSPTEAYQGLSSPTEAYQSQSSPTEAYQGLSKPTEPYQALSKPTEPYQALSSPTEAYQSLSSTIEAYQAALSPAEAYQAALRPAEAYQTVSSSAEACQGLPKPTEDDCNAKNRRDIDLKGSIRDEKTISLRFKVADNAKVRNIHFLYDLGTDSPQSVATEMVQELSFVDKDLHLLANMIDAEIKTLLPDCGGGSHTWLEEEEEEDDEEEEEGEEEELLDDDSASLFLEEQHSSYCSPNRRQLVASPNKKGCNVGTKFRTLQATPKYLKSFA